MIIDHEPPLIEAQIVFINRSNLSETERKLIDNRFTAPIEKFENEQRVWISNVEGIGKVLLKCYKFSDVNCEAAAFIVSDILNFNLVPKTVVRLIDDTLYSVQEYLSEAQPLTELNERFLEQLYLIWVFDHIIRSNDREQFNILVCHDALVAIDHEAAFYSLECEEHYDTYKSFYELPCPANVLMLMQKVVDSEELIRQRLKTDLMGLLPEKDIDETISRVFYVAKLIVTQGKIDSLSALSK